MVIIIDYNIGNLNSVRNMILKLNIGQVKISSDPDELRKADKLILPGVGAFDAGVKRLQESGLIPTLNELVLEKKIPILGICLGMQLLTHGSEEGTEKGLGWIDAHTLKFKFEEGSANKIPHMGWNYVKPRKDSGLFENIENGRFYFVHSYYVVCGDEKDIAATTFYGKEFTSSFQKNNIYGVQFHPEKSHKFGMSLLKNFINS